MMTKLGDVATYINGFAFKPSDWSEIGLPIIRIQDLTGNAYQANRYAGVYDPKYEVVDGDILISWSASLGVYIWRGETAVLNQHIFKVVFDKVDIDKDFFVYQVEAILENAASKAHGATMKHLTKPVFDALSFYLPDIDEQKHIARKLHTVNVAINLRKQQLHKLDEMVKARFMEMFGDPVKNTMKWPCLPMDDACDDIGDGLHGTPEYDDNGEYSFINGTNLANGEIFITATTKRVSECIYEKHRIYISDNAILISINGTLGNLAFYNGEKIMLGKSACYCNLKPNINRVFVYGVMSSDAFSQFLDNNSTKSTIKNVGLKAMREYKLILPPLSLQEQFSSFFEQINKMKLTTQHGLDKLELLKKTLIFKCFQYRLGEETEND